MQKMKSIKKEMVKLMRIMIIFFNINIKNMKYQYRILIKELINMGKKMNKYNVKCKMNEIKMMMVNKMDKMNQKFQVNKMMWKKRIIVSQLIKVKG